MKMFRNMLLLTVGTLVLMLGIGFYTADPGAIEKPPAETVIRLFDRIAFSAQEGKGTPLLRRWTQPVKAVLIGAPAKQEDGQIRWTDGVTAMLNLWDSLRGLEVSVAGQADLAALKAGTAPAGNLVIAVVPEAEVAGLNLPPAAAAAVLDTRGGCATVGTDATVLAQVMVVIRDDLGATMRNACLGEQLAKAFGLTIESKLAADVFRVRPSGLSFHGQGRMAVELAYDPAMTPGMPREEALKAARTALANRGVE